MIKAPFNFIPLNENLYEVTDDISLDMPYEDGLSGCFAITMTAKTPIYVRNGMDKSKAERLREELAASPNSESEYSDFNHISVNGEKKYFIPGSTIKGLARSMMESLSFGKFSQVENQSFGKRDLRDRKYMMQMMKEVRCGWMYKKNGTCHIVDHGFPIKVEAGLIDKAYEDLRLVDFISNEINNDLDKTAMKKYERFINNYNIAKFSQIWEHLEISYDTTAQKVTRLKANDDLKHLGTLVFTGQPSAYSQNSTGKKHHEFIFPDECETDIEYSVTDKVFEAFCSIHANSEDWIVSDSRRKEFCWHTRLEKGESIPVFFTLEGNTVTTIGLSRMYKYPYSKSVHNAIPEALLDNKKMDMAESIFGKVAEKKDGKSLKGRVHVGNLFAANNAESCQSPATVILGQPHPSYSPIYLRGENWDNANRVAGRKFYPARSKIYNSEGALDSHGHLVSSATVFRPLKEGTKFQGVINFFNLRPYELGALLAALTFMGKPDKYHTVGMGKPLGYGKVQFDIANLTVRPNRPNSSGTSNLASDYINLFREFMSHEITDWENSESIKELMAIGSGIPEGKENKFRYMKMSTVSRENEFLQEKKNNEALKKFTDIIK